MTWEVRRSYWPKRSCSVSSVPSLVAFAFDTVREAILLVAGDKSGGSEARFYRGLIKKGDSRFDAHLARLEAASKVRGKVKAKSGSRKR